MPDRPNILVILSDQLRRDALRCYGDPNAVTPSIDHLAQQGVAFTRACSTYPICVPFRFTFMTGEYAHSRFVPAIEWRMSPSERTLADEFNAAGYHTVYIGKWHLHGGAGMLPDHTSRKANMTPVPRSHQGRWQKWLGFELANNPFDTHYFEDDDPRPKPLGVYQTDGLFLLAMEHLARHCVNDYQPFCCVLSVEPPHFPMEAPQPLIEQWCNTDIVLPPNFMVEDERPAPGTHLDPTQRDDAIRERQIYYAMVENLDMNVGCLHAFLASHGLADNTVIMFVSDHGEMGGAHNCWYNDKDHPYEESVGIPLVIHDPRVPAQNGVSIAEPVCTEDLFPTLLGLAGLTPSTPKQGCDLTPLIHGHKRRLNREGVMLEFVHDLRKGRYGVYHEQYWRAFHSRRYKYCVLGNAREGGRPWQFFDLEQDPYEMRNLVDDPAMHTEVERHHYLLRERLTTTCDHYVLAPAFGQAGLNLWQ
jgi:arylsulfatase A-like enzyme